MPPAKFAKKLELTQERANEIAAKIHRDIVKAIASDSLILKTNAKNELVKPPHTNYSLFMSKFWDEIRSMKCSVGDVTKTNKMVSTAWHASGQQKKNKWKVACKMLNEQYKKRVDAGEG
jgi:hypothetical protein